MIALEWGTEVGMEDGPRVHVVHLRLQTQVCPVQVQYAQLCLQKEWTMSEQASPALQRCGQYCGG